MSDSLELLLRLAFIAAIYVFLLQLMLTIRRDGGLTTVRAADLAPQLVVVEPGASALAPGERVPVWPETTIGRLDGTDVQIDDQTVSTRHARIFRQGREWWIEDLGSTNGTRVNGKSVTRLVRLADGNTVDFGRIRFRWELREQPR